MGLRFPILFNLSILSSLLLSALHLQREWPAIPMDPLFFSQLVLFDGLKL